MNEPILIEALAHNSQRAFAKLYAMHAPRLMAIAVRFVKQRQVAEELVEDTFMWVWNNRRNIHFKDSLQPVLFVRMHTFLINKYREKVRSPKFTNDFDCISLVANDDSRDSFDSDDFLLCFHHAMNRLTPTQQKVVRMAKIDRMGAKQIAENLNITEQTVRNQISLGLKRLREQLGNEIGG